MFSSYHNENLIYNNYLRQTVKLPLSLNIMMINSAFIQELITLVLLIPQLCTILNRGRISLFTCNLKKKLSKNQNLNTKVFLLY